MLRDVLGFRAAETADILEITIESAASALKRARATLARRSAGTAGREPPPAPGSPAERELVRRLTEAFAAGDVDAGSVRSRASTTAALADSACPVPSPTEDEQP